MYEDVFQLGMRLKISLLKHLLIYIFYCYLIHTLANSNQVTMTLQPFLEK